MHIDELRIRRWVARADGGPRRNRIALSHDVQVANSFKSSPTPSSSRSSFGKKNFWAQKNIFRSKACEKFDSIARTFAIEKKPGETRREGKIGVRPWHIADGSTCSPTSSAKSPSTDFSRSFTDARSPKKYLSGGGCVKYHLGYGNDWTTAAPAQRIPSVRFVLIRAILSFVNTVCARPACARKQDRTGDHEPRERA